MKTMSHALRPFAFALMLFGFAIFPCAGQPLPEGISPSIGEVFEEAVRLMNVSKYDSAQTVLSAAFMQSQYALSTTDLFYLHSLEAEIMYYNALFEQGLTTAIRAHSLVERSSDSVLLGSAENLLGLLMMNLDRPQEALIHLREAVRLLPRYHGNGYLSFNYHAVANIGECFIRLQLPDSAIAYSMLSLEEADSLGKERGLAIAVWNIAEARLLQNKPDRAIIESRKGVSIVELSAHRDVVQIFYSTLMRAYHQLGMRDSVLHYLELGLRENTDMRNTDFSRMEFLEAATTLLIAMKEVDMAAKVLHDLKLLTREVGTKEQHQRIEILKQFYERNRQLSVASALSESQRQQLALQERQQVFLGALAGLLILLMVVGYRVLRQRQYIQRMEFDYRMQTTQRELELKASEERLVALNEERNRIARDLHDDIGASLSGIRIYSEAALMQAERNPQEGLLLLGRIRESAAGVMERMGDIVWSISPRNDSGESMLLRMKAFGTETLGPLGILPRYHVDDQFEKLHPNILARKNIYLIYKETVNNIAKYSRATEMEIKVSVKDGQVRLELTDNGIGFDTSIVSTGNGLRNMHDRAMAIGATLKVTSELGKGTSILLVCDVARISDLSNPPVY
jgi:signal transduction histidine kinase